MDSVESIRHLKESMLEGSGTRWGTLVEPPAPAKAAPRSPVGGMALEVHSLCEELEASLAASRNFQSSPDAGEVEEAEEAEEEAMGEPGDSAGAMAEAERLRERVMMLEEANAELQDRLDYLGPDFWDEYDKQMVVKEEMAEKVTEHEAALPLDHTYWELRLIRTRLVQATILKLTHEVARLKASLRVSREQLAEVFFFLISKSFHSFTFRVRSRTPNAQQPRLPRGG